MCGPLLVGTLALVVVVFCVSAAQAQIEGEIAVSAAPGYVDCLILDTGPGVRTIYVIHTFNMGATASRFRIAAGPGMTMTYLAEDHLFPMTAGNTQDGISVCYGSGGVPACLADDQVLVAIHYMAYGTSTPCSKILVTPHPSAQSVEAMNCSFNPVRTWVQDLNVGGSCGCSVRSYSGTTPQRFDCNPNPVEPTTWGRIKALYR
jgi:hypothetical protein